MAEYCDIYDENRNFMGITRKRSETLKTKEYKLIVDVWCVDKKGNILLTRRHPEKLFGLYWEDTGGAVKAGESTLSAAKRELFEETGIFAKEEEFMFLGTVKRYNSFTDSYVIKKDIDIKSLKLQKEEVIDAKLVSINEYEIMDSRMEIAHPASEKYKLYKNKIIEY